MTAENGANPATTGDHSPITMTWISRLKPSRETLTTLLLALSILINMWLIYEYRDFRTQEWLTDNSLTFFLQNGYADQKARVQALESLVNSYGLRAACAPAAKEIDHVGQRRNNY